ncbi:MAG: DNA-3-methyladenine glycosylase family protein [Acidimicrobiia bacterium]
MPRPSPAQAAAELAARDPVMAKLVEATGPPKLTGRRQPDHFSALCESVVYQQLAGKAAAAIYGRLCTALGGTPTPDGIIAADDTTLRSAGLSGAKAACLRALAEATTSGRLVLGTGLTRMGDDELVDQLSAVRGIGRWTAEMFLIFSLGRLDVWPVGDYGVRKGYAAAYGLPDLPTPRQLMPLGDAFRPYRTVAAWYCWRAAENPELVRAVAP